jgi:hypothetical protein
VPDEEAVALPESGDEEAVTLPAEPAPRALSDLPLVSPSTTIESAAQNALIERVNLLSRAVACRARSPMASLPSGVWTRQNMNEFIINEGGFTLSDGAVVVPVTGVYQVSMWAGFDQTLGVVIGWSGAASTLEDRFWDQINGNSFANVAGASRLLRRTAGQTIVLDIFSRSGPVANSRGELNIVLVSRDA